MVGLDRSDNRIFMETFFHFMRSEHVLNQRVMWYGVILIFVMLNVEVQIWFNSTLFKKKNEEGTHGQSSLTGSDLSFLGKIKSLFHSSVNQLIHTKLDCKMNISFIRRLLSGLF